MINTTFTTKDTKDLFKAFSWIVLLVVLSSIFGFIIAIVAFFIALMKNKTTLSMVKILILTGCGISTIITLSYITDITRKFSILSNYLGHLSNIIFLNLNFSLEYILTLSAL